MHRRFKVSAPDIVRKVKPEQRVFRIAFGSEHLELFPVEHVSESALHFECSVRTEISQSLAEPLFGHDV